ncbi:polysaccharide pyruvyl transferase family protein [Azoarcus olearius]|uniref:Polysaccharide polymerase n=1 Tax=Azoarcus sp. (strain BH72) TaxID=418699 RepID=A1KAL7_AZOSB|nr:polysaccharide pyruvyl transferase family protein [Azoarcus olearius]CAL95873.1 polysaccharide polymerase [Azoarcus olearius]
MDRTRTAHAETIDNVLAPLIPRGAAVALFDFPNYPNVGDSAIWLGTRHYLQRNGLIGRLIHIADIRLSKATGLPDLPSDCVILIQGGGNFGDIWPHHQNHREWIARHYPGNRIIQLPQSIHFDDPANLERTQRVLGAHPDFHLLVRDHPSFTIAERICPNTSRMCPDMALGLTSYSRPVSPKYAIVALMRTDKEQRGSPKRRAQHPDVRLTDWLEEPAHWMVRLDRMLALLHSRYPRKLPPLQRLHRELYEHLAEWRMARGSSLLAEGQVVITDRLHAHILCVLMDIPHVVLDNSYGKIANLRTAWSTGTEICHSTSDFDDAVRVARHLVSAHQQRNRPLTAPIAEQ